jgi:pSer/pThr/pTyr-binding forkhead associated (FHA) protein
MAYLEIRGQRHPIGIGEMAIGCDAANEVEFGGGELHSTSAILQGMPDGQVVVKRADADSEVLINGIRLGPQPTPLLHGDKIEVAGQELLFADDRRSGSTEYIKAVDPSKLGDSSKSKSKGAATAGTGGRLVSLTDGREYGITGGSVLIGRDASCDIVISAKNVSRRHAEVVATPRGYVLIDNSTNGTLVNGERVQGQHVLSRADVFRCGDHEFRFYADAAEVAAAPKQAPPPEVPPASQAPPQPEQAPSVAPPAPQPSPPSAQSAPPPTPAKGAEQRLAHTMHGMPAMPRPGQPPKKPSPPPVKPTPPPASSGGSPPNPVATPAKGAEQRLQHTMHGIPAMPRPGQPPKAPTPPTTPPVVELMPPPAAPAKPRTSGAPTSLASLLVRSGALKGHRVHVRVPIVNIGRAEYNDIVLPDDSVSTVHAKLQRR